MSYCKDLKLYVHEPFSKMLAFSEIMRTRLKRITPYRIILHCTVGEASCLRFLDTKPRCVQAYFYRINERGAQIKN